MENFRGSFGDFQEALVKAGCSGSWSDTAMGKEFKAANGGSLTWSPLATVQLAGTDQEKGHLGSVLRTFPLHIRETDWQLTIQTVADNEVKKLKSKILTLVGTMALGLLASVVLFAFYLGQLDTKVNGLTPASIQAATNDSLKAIRSATPTSPHFGFGPPQTVAFDDWIEAESDGFAVLDVTQNGKGRLWASKDKQAAAPLRSRAADSDSDMILVPKGYYFRGHLDSGAGTLRWYPLAPAALTDTK